MDRFAELEFWVHGLASSTKMNCCDVAMFRLKLAVPL